MKQIFSNIFFVLVICFSCNHTLKNQETTIESESTSIKESQKKSTTSIDIDSVYHSKILDKALMKASENIDKEVFDYYFVETMPDSSYQIEVNISRGFHFQKRRSHLIIKRNTPNTVYIDVFKNNNHKFGKILSLEEWALTFSKDSIYDINKDGIKDISIDGYGASGCCLKAFTYVYLYDPESDSFSEKFRFLNPTFSEKTKIVRGVEYGHPTYTSLYKLEWNNMSLDTLEYVYYDRDDNNELTGKVIIDDKKNDVIKYSNRVPKEYHSIYGYDWFTGDI